MRLFLDPKIAANRLREIYGEVDALLIGWSCDGTTECCRFGVTGREPYPTRIEAELLKAAVGDRGGVSAVIKRRLGMVDEKPCPLLSDEGRCKVYADRPFGCRTFFCDRAQGDGKWPRAEVLRLSRLIADLSAEAFPEDPLPRPLTRVLQERGAKRR